MGWRKSMGVKNINPQEQKPQKEQKTLEQNPFATIAPFAPVNPKIKTDPAPPPDLSKILPEHRSEYLTLWNKAWKLADYVDGGDATAPYTDRAAKLPELNQMVERMRTIESMFKTAKTPKNAPIKVNIMNDTK